MHNQLDKNQIQRAFAQSAGNYDTVAILQNEVGKRMLKRLEMIRLQPKTVFDIGAGTGARTTDLFTNYQPAHVMALDIALPMLNMARNRCGMNTGCSYVCADAEALPLKDGCCDLLFSNLVLQWCNNHDLVFSEFQRILSTNGALLFSTFGPDTLRELRDCWIQADGRTHVNTFIDMHDLGDSLLNQGFINPVMDVERFKLTYPDTVSLMRELKQLGAPNARSDRRRGLTTKATLAKVEHAYESYREADVLPATFEIIYGHAWRSTTC